MKILVVAAHPDDEVYGMGGTIAKLADEGNEVHVLIVTDGSTTQYAGRPDLEQILENKRQETSAAAQILGVKKVHYGFLPDMKLDTLPHVEVNRVIEQAVREIQPDVVYTHFYGDVNLDHQMVYRSTLVAVRPVPSQCVKELYCYYVPSSTEWSPQLTHTAFMANVKVDISKYEEKKKQALLAYKTEIREYPHPRSAQYVQEMDRVCGLQWGMAGSEGFVLLRKIEKNEKTLKQ